MSVEIDYNRFLKYVTMTQIHGTDLRSFMYFKRFNFK